MVLYLRKSQQLVTRWQGHSKAGPWGCNGARGESGAAHPRMKQGTRTHVQQEPPSVFQLQMQMLELGSVSSSFSTAHLIHSRCIYRRNVLEIKEAVRCRDQKCRA